MASFFRGRDSARRQPGGLFASPLSDDLEDLLGWKRGQQAAFVISLWTRVAQSVGATKAEWAADLRKQAVAKDDGNDNDEEDPAFYGGLSLLGREMGIRGVLTATNDVAYMMSSELGLRDWQLPREQDVLDESEITEALDDLKSQVRLVAFLDSIGKAIAEFDWRSQATKGLSEEQRNRQALFRAGTGYAEVRKYLLRHLAERADRTIKRAAASVVEAVWGGV